MSTSYGQYCPLALAAELLCQRWTLLVLSRVIDGCHQFNEIHRGVPRISPTMLSRRLSELEHAGLITRRPLPGQNGHSYHATDAGADLEGVIDQLAVWGQRWGREMTSDDLDPAFLAWSMHLRLNTDAMPAGRTVLEFEFTGTPRELRRFWLVATDGEVDMCLKHPGFETDVLLCSDLRLFVEAWRGFRDLQREIRRGRIRLSGPAELCRQLPDWLLLSALAPYARERRGREKRLSQLTRAH